MRLALFLLLAVPCSAQSYNFSLSEDPSVCFPGECNTINASGTFTVGAPINGLSPILSLAGNLNVGFGDQPVKLGPNGAFGGAGNPVVPGSPIWMQYVNAPSLLGIFSYADNRTAAGNNLLGATGLVGIKSGIAPSGLPGPLAWYAPVQFIVTPLPTTQSLLSESRNRATTRMELEVLPAVAALTYLVVRHEIRAHQHREALPSGRAAF